MKYKVLYFAISLLFLVPGVIALAIWGIRPSIDFVGGALLEVSFEQGTLPESSEKIEVKIMEVDSIELNSIQSVKDTNNYVIRLNAIDENKKNEILTKLEESFSKPTEIRFETVGPILGKELLIKTGIAIILASLVILTYVAYQFKNSVYGFSAILAMFHDSLILIGAFAIFGHFYNIEVDLLFVTAILTTLSFSVHDTIVVFDRIRESLKRKPNADIESIINRSVTETLNRSLNNSMTIIFMLTALSLLGGTTIRWFAVALLIGTISGTYSSTFTAAPILLVLLRRKRKP